MYIGKFLDGFDYAVRILFEQAGISWLPSPDCISHRNLGFINEGSPDNWFRPALPWEQYLPTLWKNLGCAKDIFYCPAPSFAIEDLPPSSMVLLGEVPLPESERRVRERFYHGIPSFLLCWRSKIGVLFLSDPLGCQLIETSDEELAALLRECSGFVLKLLHCPEIKPVSKDTLRQEAAFLRGQCAQGLHFEFFSFQNWGAVETIALRYGLMNYQTQRTRSAEFYGLSPTLFSALSEINGVYAHRDFTSLRAIEDLYWNELCTMEG